MKYLYIINAFFVATNLFLFCSENQYSLVIKNAQIADLPDVIAFAQVVFYNDLKPIILKGYAEYPVVQAGHVDVIVSEWLELYKEKFQQAVEGKNDNCSELVIAYNNTKDIIAGLCFFEKRIKEDQKSVFISFLAVNKELRQQGIGNELLLYAIKRFDDVSLCQLMTLSRGNENAQQFYEKRGFINQGVIILDPRSVNMPIPHYRNLEKILYSRKI